ncbi:hypothetical protein KIW84_025495 [Lathyrus oleraceus]|uniref:Uncharacterized protein n=1 Tax=Pisum sativum TaxID=3888 RepID=A0A9D4YJD5_PEA|nr:hypothetical protein KIW84_025492 [Pisum sativum]KAI5440174.1 hypothetical protein KIW84_025495 [Pisum sativum]
MSLIKPLLPFLVLERTIEALAGLYVYGREGVQQLILLLRPSSEQQQECAIALLCLLSDENVGSKWAITAVVGIPPLVQISESGSAKAKITAATL